MPDSSRPVKTNQVDGVLQNYLDQLLISATEQPVALASKPTVIPSVEEPVVVKTKVERPVEREEVTQQSVIETQDIEVDEADVLELQQVLEDISTKSELATLNWDSAQGVDCLIFKVAGLKLAIPLPLLGGVFPVTEKTTSLIGQHAWSLGVWQGEEGKLTIIDSARLIMPERNVNLNESGYSFFIQLDRSPWALACQEICDTVTLKQGSIKWRGDTSKRPWLAGTVIAEMCALIDVPGVLTLLEEHRLSK